MKASEYLKEVSRRPEMFVNPFNIQNLKSFLDGFDLGYLLAKDNLQFSDKVAVWKYVVKSRGWTVNSLGIEREMRAKGKTDAEIMDELIQVNIEMWKHLEEI